MRLIINLSYACAVLLAGLVMSVRPLHADAGADRTAIRQIMRATFDKPEAPLRVDPIAVAADFAVADWAQGDMGGRALLRRKDGQWSIVLCSGDALKSADTLIKAAVPQAAAAAIEKELSEAEAGLDPRVVAQFSRFEGLVMMDATGAHPAHKH